MQYDVYHNPIARARRAFPYVAVLQSDLAETGNDRVVAFLAPHAVMVAVAGRLMPIVSLEGKEYVLLIPSITTLPASGLRNGIGNVSTARERITAALDWLFLGV